MSAIGKKVCHNCIKESYLEKYIQNNGNTGDCSYCRCNTTVCTIEEMAGIIEDGFKFRYSLLEDHQHLQDKCDLDFIIHGAKYFKDSLDLLHKWLKLCPGQYELQNDLCELLPISSWFDETDYTINEGERKGFTWNYFSWMVQHQTRYIFTEERYPLGSKVAYEKPSEILPRLLDLFERFNLYTSLPKGTIIYRCRKKEENIAYSSDMLGSPPPEICSRPNRFSPAGISMFYGAADQETCLKEIGCNNVEDTITGIWELSRDITILDLTKCFSYSQDKYEYSGMPSIFDKTSRDDRADYEFILRFATDISKPCEETTEGYAYVPTQIVAEYLRVNKSDVSGICSYSSKITKKNYTLFLNDEDCKASEKIKLLPEKQK